MDKYLKQLIQERKDTLLKYGLEPGDKLTVKKNYNSKCENFIVDKNYCVRYLNADGSQGFIVNPLKLLNILENSKVVN